MSNTMRWVLGIVLFLAGIGFALFAVFGGAFMTVGCFDTPPDIAYTVLLIGGVISALGAIVPAIMLIRQADTRRVVIVFILGVILSCFAYGGYFSLLSGSC